MALDKDFFDSIHIDVVKKKYYNAGKVEALLQDIRTQAETLTEENEKMKLQLSGLDSAKLEISDAIISARKIYNDIIKRANAEADAIIADAESKRQEILDRSSQQQEQSVQRVEKLYTRLKEQHLACIDVLNTEWQDFLCDLYVDEDAPETPAESAPETEPTFEEAPLSDATIDIDFKDIDALSLDIKAKMDAIAKELFSLESI